MKRASLSVALLALYLAACTKDQIRGPVEPRPTRPDGTPSDPTDKDIPDAPAPEFIGADKTVCDHVRTLGCSTGTKCETAMARARIRHVEIPSTCFLQAADPNALRKCGDPTYTLTFSCL